MPLHATRAVVAAPASAPTHVHLRYELTAEKLPVRVLLAFVDERGVRVPLRAPASVGANEYGAAPCSVPLGPHTDVSELDTRWRNRDSDAPIELAFDPPDDAAIVGETGESGALAVGVHARAGVAARRLLVATSGGNGPSSVAPRALARRGSAGMR